MGKLGLVREDGGNGLAEVLADGLLIALVGDLHEALDGLLVQGIDVGLVVVPGRGRRQLQVGIPGRLLAGSRLVIRKAAV